MWWHLLSLFPDLFVLWVRLLGAQPCTRLPSFRGLVLLNVDRPRSCGVRSNSKFGYVPAQTSCHMYSAVQNLPQRVQVIGHRDFIPMACHSSAGITGSLFSSASSSAAGLSSGVPACVLLTQSQTDILLEFHVEKIAGSMATLVHVVSAHGFADELGTSFLKSVAREIYLHYLCLQSPCGRETGFCARKDFEGLWRASSGGA